MQNIKSTMHSKSKTTGRTIRCIVHREFKRYMQLNFAIMWQQCQMQVVQQCQKTRCGMSQARSFLMSPYNSMRMSHFKLYNLAKKTEEPYIEWVLIIACKWVILSFITNNWYLKTIFASGETKIWLNKLLEW